MATRTIKGTLDTFTVDAGSDVVYLGNTTAGSTGSLDFRAFRVNPSGIGDIVVTLDKTNGITTMEIFQEDNYTGGSAPTGYKKFANIVKDGKGKGVVAVTVTDASKDYVVLLNLDGYSEVSYIGSVVVPWFLAKHKEDDSLKDYPFLTAKGIKLIRTYTTPRTYIGSGRYASYRDYGEDIWRIGYGSKKLKGHWIRNIDRATQKEIDIQFLEDLKKFSNEAAKYVFVPLNENRKAALLSFAHSLGISGFKHSRLLELINTMRSKNEIIREWSPYINVIWRSGGEHMISRRRTELDTYLTPDKQIPTFVAHNCATDVCLLNLAETYNGAPTQVKAIEYLEKKINAWDPSGDTLKRFWRYWTEKPSGLSSPPRWGNSFSVHPVLRLTEVQARNALKILRNSFNFLAC